MSNFTSIPCCICGVSIQPNKVNMCVACLRDRVDITEGLSKQNVVYFCKGCGRHSTIEGSSKNKYISAELESPELLSLCLKSIHGLGKGKKDSARLVDAKWIWTEPHSRRLKIDLELEKEVMNGALLRQRMLAEFHVQYKYCMDCTKETVDQNWNTTVQLRQKVQHKRTLLKLEQKLLKEKATKLALDILPVKNGLDVKFATKAEALKFCDAVLQIVPARRKKESKSHIGTDVKNNVTKYKFTIPIDVSPICKDDILILSKKMQNSLFGGKSALVLCDHVTTSLRFIDPTNMAVGILNKDFVDLQPLLTSRDLVEFVVLDVQLIQSEVKQTNCAIKNSDKEKAVNLPKYYANAEVEVARTSDLGLNDTRFIVNCHLGNILQAGDSALGYDFTNHNFPDEIMAPLKGAELPNVVLVKKASSGS